MQALNSFRLIITIFYILANSVQAQQSSSEMLDSWFDMTLEELLQVRVDTATKTEHSLREVPAIVSVITAAQIEAYGYQSVAEAISHVAGLVDSYDLALHNVGVRGINAGVRAGSRTIKFMIDGQAVSFRATSQNFIDRELIPMVLIERIEIIRGPVSALYGANAFLGVVNVVSKNAERYQQQHHAASIDAGTIAAAGDSWHGSYTGGGRSGDFAGVLGITTGSSDRAGLRLPQRSPDYPLYQQNPAAEQDQAKPFSFYGRLHWQQQADQRLILSAHLQRLDVNNTFSDLNPLRAESSRLVLDNAFLRLQYEQDISQNILLRASVAAAKGDPGSDDKIETGAANFFIRRDLSYDGLDANLEMLWRFEQGRSLLLGLDSNHDSYARETFRRVDRLSGAQTRINPSGNESITNLGAYFQWQANLWQDWSGIVGARLDDNSYYGHQQSYRLGLVGQLPGDLTLKLLGGNSFQAPSSELLFRNAIQTGDIIGNPDLAPQKAQTIELSLSGSFAGHGLGTLTLFDTLVDNLVSFDSNYFNLLARNGNKSQIRGIELELRWQWQQLSGYANYTFQKTRREPNPLTLSPLEQRPDGELFPAHSGNFGLSYHWSQLKTRLSLDNRYVGERQASTQNIKLSGQQYSLSAYLDTSLSATIQLGRPGHSDSSLRLQLHDLFDVRYADPGFGGIDFPSEGRRYSISYQTRF